MKLLNQINDAITKSEEAKVPLKFEWRNEKQRFGNFRTPSKENGRYLLGSFVVKGDDIFARIHQTSYTKKYAKRKFRYGLSKMNVGGRLHFFESNFEEEVLLIKDGDEVLTRQFIDQCTAGDECILIDSMTCYSINSDLIEDCNGQPFRFSYRAQFISQNDYPCGNNMMDDDIYTKFLIIEQL